MLSHNITAEIVLWQICLQHIFKKHASKFSLPITCKTGTHQTQLIGSYQGCMERKASPFCVQVVSISFTQLLTTSFSPSHYTVLNTPIEHYSVQEITYSKIIFPDSIPHFKIHWFHTKNVLHEQSIKFKNVNAVWIQL